MTTASSQPADAWLLDQAQEDALHASRLLQVEERPFQRLTKSLLGKDSYLRTTLQSLPSPTPSEPNPDDTSSTPDLSTLHDPIKALKFRHEILLDFANLESSLIRIQLILSSNARERERYAAEKARILSTAQAVRADAADLRTHLVDAQRVLEQRKEYDALAGKILDDTSLRSRDDARAEIARLEKEIEDLRAESAGFEETWRERRVQFDRVVGEGEAMVRLIKGIVEVEKGEGNDKDGEEGEEGDDADTPLPDGRSPRPTDVGGGGATPMVLEGGDEGGATPMRPVNRLLDVEDASRPPSQVGSPLVQATQVEEDVDMAGSELVEKDGQAADEGEVATIPESQQAQGHDAETTDAMDVS